MRGQVADRPVQVGRSIEQARTVDMDRNASTARNFADRFELGNRVDRAAAGVVRVLEADEPRSGRRVRTMGERVRNRIGAEDAALARSVRSTAPAASA